MSVAAEVEAGGSFCGQKGTSTGIKAREGWVVLAWGGANARHVPIVGGVQELGAVPLELRH